MVLALAAMELWYLPDNHLRSGGTDYILRAPQAD